MERLGLPTVVIQEGGYYLPDLGINARAWLRGFLGLDAGPPVPRPASLPVVPTRHV